MMLYLVIGCFVLGCALMIASIALPLRIAERMLLVGFAIAGLGTFALLAIWREATA